MQCIDATSENAFDLVLSRKKPYMACQLVQLYIKNLKAQKKMVALFSASQA